MAATAVQEKRYTPTMVVEKQKLVSWREFENKYLTREDNFKYEWANGLIEKTPRTMNRDQSLIIQRLQRLFTTTQAYRNMGELISELDMFLPTAKRTRRADFGYLTSQQVAASVSGDMSPSSFVVEIISKNDQINDVDKKLIEYFDNGVEVIWLVFPTLKKVEVHRSLRDVSVYFGDDVCSASPILSDFEISVNVLLS
jgi:Uma2 family endonuclease